MMNTEFRIAQPDWAALRRIFRPSFAAHGAAEAGAIGVLGVSDTPRGREYLMARLFPPRPGDLKVADHQELVFDASYIRRAHLYMRQSGLAGLAFFHTHPMADDHVSFSSYDNDQEPRLVQNLQDLAPSTHLVSVVAGRRSLCGRVWTSPRHADPLARMAVVGETLDSLRLDGRAEEEAPPAAAAFDRARALTGQGALARLASMTVAVVGVSGTGSLVAELLMRAGCRRLVVIDPDVMKEVNLNRVLHGTAKDVAEKRTKVDVLKDALARVGLGCSVEAIPSNVLLTETLLRLREADAVIGCVDRAWPRKLLSEFSARYLKPYIDVGTEIGADKSEAVVALNARANYVAPGRPCLVCTGLVTPRQLEIESLAAGERERKRAQGYSDDLFLAQPAVMDLNMHAAGTAVLLLRHLLQPFLSSPVPVTISENLVTYKTLAIPEARAAQPDCPICRCNPQAGWGDRGDRMGIDEATLESLEQPHQEDDGNADKPNH